MDIKSAKDQVRKACIAYLTKDEFGDYIVPVETQRPVFLLGAPGVGKTAIVSQVASELDLALVDYSMTHHTRQSAIGLPLIEKRVYDGKEFSISEYTMSEIIASLYEEMQLTGKSEGILFLDEINCVSETLTPALLRFLQSKTFGEHRVPNGWVIVCAGNPTEYNRTARSFDIATLDRLKRVDVEPDYQAWRAYATTHEIHPAVLSFLDVRPDCFYRIETKGLTQRFATARAWSDLSSMMRLYERHSLEIDESLITQYIQLPAVATDFNTYLTLFFEYSKRYSIKDILAGQADETIMTPAKAAGFDERACLGGLLVDAMATAAESSALEQRALYAVREVLEQVLSHYDAADENVKQTLTAAIDEIETDLTRNALRYRDDYAARFVRNRTKAILENMVSLIGHSKEKPSAIAAESFNELLAEYERSASSAADSIGQGISFINQAFGEGPELVLCLASITANPLLADIVTEQGCEEYFAHQDLLMINARAKKLEEKAEGLTEVAQLIKKASGKRRERILKHGQPSFRDYRTSTRGHSS